MTQRDLFIDVTPNRTRIREQEAVLLTYRIHVRAGVALSNTSLTQKPDFKGLISQEIPLPGNQIQTTIEHRGGATYRTGTILQYVVFPQKAGRITIPSITFDCAVLQQDHTMDLADAFFNGGGTVGVQVRRKVPEITLQVDALPQPKPANFSGAVGKFNLQGKLLTPNVRTNDVATYRITLNGLGNMKLISAPTVNFPKDFDTYDPKTNEKQQPRQADCMVNLRLTTLLCHAMWATIQFLPQILYSSTLKAEHTAPFTPKLLNCTWQRANAQTLTWINSWHCSIAIYVHCIMWRARLGWLGEAWHTLCLSCLL